MKNNVRNLSKKLSNGYFMTKTLEQYERVLF